MTLRETDRQALIANSRNKSHAAVENVAFLLENNNLTLAVNQIYYGIFYMLSALAIKHGFMTSKHKAGSIKRTSEISPPLKIIVATEHTETYSKQHATHPHSTTALAW